MDPLTALAAIVTAVTDLVKTVVESQPPEVKRQIWEWYIEDMKRWRKLFKLDQEGQ